MIKVLARPTNNADQFCGQSKRGKIKSEHFKKFCVDLHEIFGFHGINISSFVVCFNVVDNGVTKGLSQGEKLSEEGPLVTARGTTSRHLEKVTK